MDLIGLVTTNHKPQSKAEAHGHYSLLSLENRKGWGPQIAEVLQYKLNVLEWERAGTRQRTGSRR